DSLPELRRIDLVPRLRHGVDGPSAHETIDHLAVAEEQAATLTWRALARVRHDLIPQRARQDDARTIDQRPPAIAGMTITSLPSGTTAPPPPRVRASSSPM